MPIPGTTKAHRLHENTATVDVTLTQQDLAELTTASGQIDVQGDRYPEHMQKWIDR